MEVSEQLEQPALHDLCRTMRHVRFEHATHPAPVGAMATSQYCQMASAMSYGPLEPAAIMSRAARGSSRPCQTITISSRICSGGM